MPVEPVLQIHHRRVHSLVRRAAQPWLRPKGRGALIETHSKQNAAVRKGCNHLATQTRTY